MKTLHSPGPWDTDGVYIVDANGEKLCETYAVDADDGKRRNPVADANARLMASAPNLLEMLIHARMELYEIAAEEIGSGRYSYLDDAINSATRDLS